MKKNGKIELLRFLFSISVLCFHMQKYFPGEIILGKKVDLDFFPHGATGVEFFFIVSGFLMAASIFYASEHKKSLPLGDATFAYIKNKYMAILPMRLIVFILLFVITALAESWVRITVITKFISYIPGLFLVQMAGFGNVYINHIEWYLSVMLIGMLFLYPLLRKFYNAFAKVVAPLIAIFTLGYMFKTYGRLTGVTSWEGLCYRSMLRGISELCLGIVCFEICRNLKDLPLNKWKRIAFTCFELFCWVSVFTMVMFTFPRKFEFYILIFIAIGTICSFSELSYGSALFDNKLCFYLGKLSLPIYLCQLLPVMLVPKYLGMLSMHQQMLAAFVFTLILSVLLLHGSNLLTKTKKQVSSIS